MSWLIRIYSGGFSKITFLSDQTRNAIHKFKQKLSHFLYETYTRFRIEQLFDIIIGHKNCFNSYIFFYIYIYIFIYYFY